MSCGNKERFNINGGIIKQGGNKERVATRRLATRLGVTKAAIGQLYFLEVRQEGKVATKE